MAAKVEEVIRRLVLPEIRKVVKEELADLKIALDERFKATTTQISEVRVTVDDLRVTVDERFKGVEARIDTVNERINGLHGALETLKLMPRLVELERKVATLEAKATSAR